MKKITEKLLQCSEVVFGLKYESGPPEKKSSGANLRARCTVIITLPKFYTVKAVIYGFVCPNTGH